MSRQTHSHNPLLSCLSWKSYFTFLNTRSSSSLSALPTPPQASATHPRTYILPRPRQFVHPDPPKVKTLILQPHFLIAPSPTRRGHRAVVVYFSQQPSFLSSSASAHMSTTTVLTHQRAVTAAESIRVPPTSLPAVPDLLPPTNSSPKSHPALPPPSLSRFIELFDLAGSSHTTTQAESSGRGVIVYVPHPRTRALVPVWKQPSLPESSSRPHDYHPGMHSPTPLLSPSARRYSSPGNLAPSGSAIPRRSESPILLRPHSPTRSHTQLEPRPQIVPLETTVDVAARPPAPVNGQARWPSHAVNAPSNQLSPSAYIPHVVTFLIQCYF